MPDVNLPDDLISLRHEFLAAQEELSALSKKWSDAQAKCRRLAKTINDHPHWKKTDDPKAARTALDNITTAPKKATGEQPA